MLNININDLEKENRDKTNISDLSRFILPLSGEKQVLYKIISTADKVSQLYQHCDMCCKETPHSYIRNNSGLYATCIVCSYGYKIGL